MKHQFTLTTLATLVLLCAAQVSVASKSFVFTCPQTIVTKESLSSDASDFNSRELSATHHFEFITFYRESPNQSASLAPSKHSDMHSSWSFDPNAKVYVGCGYSNSSIELQKPLPDHTSSCTVDYNTQMKGAAGYIPKQITCM